MITGNWIVENLGADSQDFGFFVMPPMEAGGSPVSTGGAGSRCRASVAPSIPDAAAAYIDWMTSDHAADLLLPTGQIPLSVGAPTPLQEGTVLADVVNAAATVSESNGMVPYLDWATPTFYDTTTAAIQELMAARITPAGVRREDPGRLLDLPELANLMDAEPAVASRAVAVGSRQRPARRPERLPGEARWIGFLYVRSGVRHLRGVQPVPARSGHQPVLLRLGRDLAAEPGSGLANYSEFFTDPASGPGTSTCCSSWSSTRSCRSSSACSSPPCCRASGSGASRSSGCCCSYRSSSPTS